MATFRRAPHLPRAALWLILVTGLVVILVLLATLQYRWSAQVSAAQRQQLQANLENATRHFQQDFSDELRRIGAAFPTNWQGEPDPQTYAERWSEWIRTADHPRLIHRIFLWSKDPADETPLLELDSPKSIFLPASWPANYQTVQELVSIFTDDEQPHAPVFAWLWEDQALALIRPILRRPEHGRPVTEGCVIVELDRDVLRDHLLPELVRQEFSGIGVANYQVAVTNAAAPAPLFVSDPQQSSPAQWSSADVAAPLVTLPRNRHGNRREFHELSPEDIDRPFPMERRAVVLAASPPDAVWQLRVKHRAGSLEAAVARMRWRNLAVSFSVLILLGVSLALILVFAHRAQKLAEMQLNFVAGVSHEIRTPLAVIGSAADNLAKGIVRNESQIKQYGSLIQGQRQRLTELVEQVLQFATSQSRRAVQPRPVEIESVVEQALASVRDSGVEIEQSLAPSLPPVWGDEAILVRCLVNLLTNAIKYGDHAWVGLRARLVGQEVQLSVEDRGMGIDADDLSQLGQPFFRAERVRDAQIPGTGLGLNLTKESLRSLGATLTIASTPGKGSCFTMHLPVAPASAQEPLRQSA